MAIRHRCLTCLITPLTKEDNPTFNRADLFKMIVHCLMRYGTAHILITYNN